MPTKNDSPVSIQDLIKMEEILKRLWYHDHIGAASVILDVDTIFIMRKIIERHDKDN